jgi:FeS assembly SUF system protein
VSEDGPFPTPPPPRPAPTPPVPPAPAPVGDAPMPPEAGAGPLDPVAALARPSADLREEVIDVLETCFDPEIPVNIYDLGLIYGIDIADGPNDVEVRMTLTSPACPVAETLPLEVQKKVQSIPGVGAVKVSLVWEPPWGKHLLSEGARLQLGMGYD